MRIADLAQSLRDTSERFGGIPDHLATAGEIDRAWHAFLAEHTLGALQVLNGAVAKAERLRKCAVQKPHAVPDER
jgi:hypothetical protein